MSVRAMTWAMAQRAGGPAAKAVLLCLADKADQNHACYPSQELLAIETEQSVDTVQRKLAALEAAGLIRRDKRGADGARGRGTDLLTLAVEGPFETAGESPAATGEMHFPHCPLDGDAGGPPAIYTADCGLNPEAAEAGIDPADGPDPQRFKPQLCGLNQKGIYIPPSPKGVSPETERAAEPPSPDPDAPEGVAGEDAIAPPRSPPAAEPSAIRREREHREALARFAAFEARWRWRAGEPVAAARRAFLRLSAGDQRMALDAVAGWIARLDKRLDKPAKAARWLAGERFRTLRGVSTAEGGIGAPRFEVRFGTDAFRAWAAHWRAEHGDRPMFRRWSQQHGCDVITRPSLFPPAAVAARPGEASGTDPPAAGAA